jgi:hypothetical protein
VTRKDTVKDCPTGSSEFNVVEAFPRMFNVQFADALDVKYSTD